MKQKTLSPAKKRQKAWESFQKTGILKGDISEAWFVLHQICCSGEKDKDKDKKDFVVGLLASLPKEYIYPVASRLLLSLVNQRDDAQTQVISGLLQFLSVTPSTMPKVAFYRLGNIMGQSLPAEQLRSVLEDVSSEDFFWGALKTCGMAKSGENIPVVFSFAPKEKKLRILLEWCSTVENGNVPQTGVKRQDWREEIPSLLSFPLHLRMSRKSLTCLADLVSSFDKRHNLSYTLESVLSKAVVTCATYTGLNDKRLYFYSRRALGLKNLSSARDFLIPRLTAPLYETWVQTHNQRNLIIDDDVFSLSEDFPDLNVIGALKKNQKLLEGATRSANDRSRHAARSSAIVELYRRYLEKDLKGGERPSSVVRKL